MNQQPYATPPRWWSPRLSPMWIRLWRPWRRRRGGWEHGLSSVEVQGQEHVLQAQQRGQSILITPNHPSHADPFVLLEVGDRLEMPMFFMTAWQVFAHTHRVGRWVLRQHGCFSVNREGFDLRAVRQSVRILQQGTQPLVIFPEGEVLHLNDRVLPFREGAVAAAQLAARHGNRTIAVIPCGLKYTYVEDPLPALRQAMDRLESAVGLRVQHHWPVPSRIRRLAAHLMAAKETEYLGAAQRGTLQQRRERLIAVILGRLEDRHQIFTPRGTIPERVKQLRYRTIRTAESVARGPSPTQHELDMRDLFLVMQLFSYPVDYLQSGPSIERLAETVDKLEEDVFGVHRTPLRGLRRAVVRFGDPIVLTPSRARLPNSAEVTGQLQGRVQQLVDSLNWPQTPAWAASVSAEPAHVISDPLLAQSA